MKTNNLRILDLSDSNTKIKELIEQDKPFSIVRLGSAESYISRDYLINNKINKHYLKDSINLNGIYSKKKDINKFILFCDYHNNSIKNSDILASFNNILVDIQNYYSSKYNLPKIHSRSLEPFYIMQENKIPWSHSLKDKKVLIINPFVASFQKQLDNGFQIFKNKKLFHDDQEFVFYKSFQTIAGNHIHSDWFETFTIMCEDIKKLDFDIALLGCGGYGLPLCDFIKTKMKKSAIYIGGGLQLMFGVMGKRWEVREDWKKIIKDNDTKFIKPSKEEKCSNYKQIEDGCYW